MIAIVMIIIAYISPVLIGWVGVTMLQNRTMGKLALAEIFALSYLLGVGLLSFYIFYLGLLRVEFSLGSTIILPILAIVILLIMAKKYGLKYILKTEPQDHCGGMNFWGKTLVTGISVLLLWKLAFIGFLIVSKPTYFDDSVSNYNYKAKNFYYNHALILNPDHPDFLGGHEPRYPNLSPLFKMWVSLCRGEWSESAVNLNTLFFFVALGLIAYYNLIRVVIPGAGLIFTYALLSIPLLTFHAGFAHMDIVVSIYFFGGIIYLIRWIREKDRLAFFLSALLFSVGISAKDDLLGLFIGGALPTLLLYQLIQRRNFGQIVKTMGCYLGIVLSFNIPWFVVKIIYHLASGPPKHFRIFEFHPEAFSILGSYIFSSGNYNILWTIFFVTLVFSYSLIVRTELKYIVISIVGASIVILALFVFTPFFEFLRIGTTINRALLSLLPIIILYIAVAYGKFTQPNKNSPCFGGNELENKRS